MVSAGDPSEVYDEFPKYHKWGYIQGEDHSDLLLKTFLQELPAEFYLPTNWKYHSQQSFIDRFSQFGIIIWSASTTSHLLLISGVRVLRIWTDAKKHCWVDSFPHILQTYESIPCKNSKKSAPFEVRRKILTTEEMYSLAKHVKMVYGV